MQGRKQLKYALAILLAFLCISLGKAQDVGGKVVLLEPITEIGRPFKVKLEIYHPENVPVIFPDTGFGLGRLEYIKQDLYPTQTDEGRSIDNTVYHFYTWDIAEKQAISFPFKYVVDGDTLESRSNIDSITVNPAISVMSDSLKLKFLVGTTEISEPLNKTFITILIIALILIIGAAIFFLQKPLRKRIQQWRLERDWKRVVEQLQSIQPQINQQGEFISGLNAIWKGYLQNSGGRALRTLTTTELMRELDKDTFGKLQPYEREVLLRASRSGDMILYAGLKEETPELENIFKDISNVLETEYHRKKSEVMV